ASVSEAQIHQTMASVDPNLPVIWIRPLREQVAGVFRQQRLIARFTSLFGILSLVLACIGMYGVTAYHAGSLTRVVGVRKALGARRGSAARLILMSALRMTLARLVLGLPVTLAAGRILETQLYGVNPFSASVTSGAAAAMGLCAFLASLIPAL